MAQMNLEFFIRSLYKHLMLLKKIPHHFFSISKVLEMSSTSVAIRRSFLALTSNWSTCMSSSAGVETQQTLRYQLPAEEICHGATSKNLRRILGVGLNSINSVQLSWSLSNPATSGEAQGQRVPGRGCHLLHRRRFVPHTPIFIKPCLLAFIF